MTTHAGPHVHVEGECSWEFTGEGTHLFCTELVVVGSDECDGTDHPHHAPLDVSPPVARVEDAGSRPLAATVGDEGAVRRVRVGSRVRRRPEGRSGLPGQVNEP